MGKRAVGWGGEDEVVERNESTRMYLHLVQLGLGLLSPPQEKCIGTFIFFYSSRWMEAEMGRKAGGRKKRKRKRRRKGHCGWLERLQLIETKLNSKE